MTIFGPKTRNDGAQVNPEAAQIARDEELAAYWKGRFEKAKDGHETMQIRRSLGFARTAAAGLTLNDKSKLLGRR